MNLTSEQREALMRMNLHSMADSLANPIANLLTILRGTITTMAVGGDIAPYSNVLKDIKRAEELVSSAISKATDIYIEQSENSKH